MSQFMLLTLLVVVLVTLSSAVQHLDNGLIFEDIRIENLDRSLEKKVSSLRSRKAPLINLNDPTFAPTAAPTTADQLSVQPTFVPTEAPTETPTEIPTEQPTEEPTYSPTVTPTYAPSAAPTVAPTFAPSVPPTFAPTFAPTRTPTFAPSANPTFTPAPTAAVSEGVKITGVLTAVGTTASQFNSNPNNAYVFGLAIDQASNVPSGSTQVGQAFNPSRRQLMAVEATSSAIVPFTISLTSTTSAGYPNADSAYNSITVLLSTAINTNQLTTLVQTIATQNNLVVVNVTTDSVSFSGYVATPPPSNHRRYVNDGEIAGIVIGSIVGVALVGTLIYYLLRMRRSSIGEEAQKGDDRMEIYRDVGEPAAITNGEDGVKDQSLVVASQNDTRI